MALCRCLREHPRLAWGTYHTGAGNQQVAPQPSQYTAAANPDGEGVEVDGGAGGSGVGARVGWEVVLVAGGSVVRKVREVERLSRLVQEMEVGGGRGIAAEDGRRSDRMCRNG